MSRLGLLLVFVPVFAAFELGAHAFIRMGVPSDADYRAAAAFVRAQLAADDAITIAPGWADPVLREHLGDRIPLSMAGRSDLAAYRRLWALSIRGHRPDELAGQRPELMRVFGRVTVLRYGLVAPTVTYDFTAHVFDAKLTVGDRPCRERRSAPGRGGGLGKATVLPAHRIECEPGDPRRFVAPVVIEDLSLAPRHCVYQPVHGGGPVRARFSAVPLADSLQFYAGLYYEDERKREGDPVDMRVLVNGQERGHMHHRDGDGWSALSIDTAFAKGSTGEVIVEVSAASAHKRGFCWAGSVRRAASAVRGTP